MWCICILIQKGHYELNSNAEDHKYNLHIDHMVVLFVLMPELN